MLQSSRILEKVIWGETALAFDSLPKPVNMHTHTYSHKTVLWNLGICASIHPCKQHCEDKIYQEKNKKDLRKDWYLSIRNRVPVSIIVTILLTPCTIPFPAEPLYKLSWSVQE